MSLWHNTHRNFISSLERYEFQRLDLLSDKSLSLRLLYISIDVFLDNINDFYDINIFEVVLKLRDYSIYMKMDSLILRNSVYN